MVCLQTQCTSRDNRVMIDTPGRGLVSNTYPTQRKSYNYSMPYKALIGTFVLLNMLVLGFICELPADNHHTYCTCVWRSPRETTHNSGGFPTLRGSQLYCTPIPGLCLAENQVSDDLGDHSYPRRRHMLQQRQPSLRCRVLVKGLVVSNVSAIADTTYR